MQARCRRLLSRRTPLPGAAGSRARGRAAGREHRRVRPCRSRRARRPDGRGRAVPTSRHRPAAGAAAPGPVATCRGVAPLSKVVRGLTPRNSAARSLSVAQPSAAAVSRSFRSKSRTMRPRPSKRGQPASSSVISTPFSNPRQRFPERSSCMQLWARGAPDYQRPLPRNHAGCGRDRCIDRDARDPGRHTGWPGPGVREFARRVRDHLRMRRSIVELRSLDDRSLDDIGLTPADRAAAR